MQESINNSRVTYIQITNKCNATCIMCDMWKEQGKDMALPDIINLLNVISTSSPFSEIRLTGGEPCMHDQFLQIINEIDKRNLHKSIITNGFLFSNNNIEEINFDRIFISVDSPIKKGQKHIRGLEFNFSNKLGFNIIANVIISKLNKSIITKIPEWLAQNNIRMINIIPMKDERFFLSKKEFSEVLNLLILSCKTNKINHFVEGIENLDGIDMDIVNRNIFNFNPERKCKIQDIVRFITLNEEIFSCNSTPHRSYSISNNEPYNCMKCQAYNSNYCDLSNILFNSLVQ